MNFVIKERLFSSPGSLSKLRPHKLVAHSSIDIEVLLVLMIPPLFGSFINSEFFRETIPMPLKCAGNGLNGIFECLPRMLLVLTCLISFVHLLTKSASLSLSLEIALRFMLMSSLLIETVTQRGAWSDGGLISRRMQ